MPLGFLLKSVKGCDYDTDELYVSAEHATYIKNMCLDLNDNASVPDGQSGTEGANMGVFTPFESTQVLCPMPLPEGDNYCIGYHESKETNEGYVFVYNSLSNHLVYVIDGLTGQCQRVRQTPCLKFKLAPQNFISLGRCVLQTTCFFNKATGKEERIKYLIFTDNQPPVKFISVTDAIATNNFSLPFFQNDNCAECDLLSLGVATPNSCIKIEPIARTTSDVMLDNLINNKVFQWRIKFIDVWGRETEHGIISDAWYPTTGACVKESSGQSRCVNLTFDAGCATINKIQIEYRVWSSNDPNVSIATDWFLHDTLDKYDLSNVALQWYQRSINPDLNYVKADNTIRYTFCADKGTTALPVEETNRNFNPLAVQAAGVFSINKSIGTVNHWRNFPPLDLSLLDQIKFETEKPTAENACSPKPRTIVVYGYIRCLQEDSYQLLHNVDSNIRYGADNGSVLKDFKQELPAGQTGFVGYFAGTSEFAISEQVVYRRRQQDILVVQQNLNGIGQGDQGSPYLVLQRWTFKNATPGKKIFRVANQQAPPTGDYQKTSIASMGTSRLDNIDVYVHENQFEILIDQCDGDVDLLTRELFIIADLTNSGGGIRRISNVCQGYLYEDEVSRIPVDRAYIDSPSHAWSPRFTDHNGFYFATSKEKGWHVTLYSTKNCVRGEMAARSNDTYDAPDSKFRDEKLYMYQSTNEYPHTDRIYLKGRVVICGTTNGVSGVLVMLTNGSTAISDDNGNWTIIAHDSGLSESPRKELIKFAQVGLCGIGRCDNQCSVCFDDIPVEQPPCGGGQDRNVVVQNLSVQIRTVGLRGPQNGGRYELGIVPYYNIGQPASVQRRPSHVLDIPTIGQTGVYGFSRIKYTIPSTVTFPVDVKYFTFVISANLLWDKFLTWIAEKIEFVDATGNINNAAPTQVKLYYTSLPEYNVQNGLATNAVWQFLDSNKNPVIGDKIEFISNGDGTLYTNRVTALVKFDQAGAYVLVNYNDDLKGLKDGAQIKLLRPHLGTNSHFFYEICKKINVTNGKIAAADATGYLNYFDSYMIPRQIPIPYYSIDPVTKLQVKDTSKSILKTFTFPFEHNSPSDFWSAGAANRGRVYTVNPFQNRQCFSTEIAVSKALANDGVLNGLSYFQEADFTEFDKQEWGSITCVIPNIGTLTVICEQDNFEVPFDDNTLRLNKDDQTLSLIPLSGRLGRPQRKRGSNYGCHPEDINTIRSEKGLVMFLDRAENGLITLNAGDGADVSYNGFKGHLKDKIKHMIQFNQEDKLYMKYWHGVVDPRRKQYLLTLFTIPRNDNPNKKLVIDNYVNNLREKSITANETIGYSPYEQSLKEAYSPTPEYWGTLSGHKFDAQLISFKNGVAHLHHQGAATTSQSYLNFYGVLCDAVYEVVLNVEPNAVKRFQWTEVLCREQLFFADRIITESGQRSRLLNTWWEKRENFFTADFKMDLNTFVDTNIEALTDPSRVILEGNPLSGKWIKVRYVAHPDKVGKYFEMDGVHLFIFMGQKSGTSQAGERFSQDPDNDHRRY